MKFSLIKFFVFLAILISLVLVFIFRDALIQEAFGGPGIKVDKKDKDWLETYCKQMVAALPPPPFTYLKKGEAKGMTGPIHTRTVIPKEELKRSKTCGIGYKFNERQAYAEMGVEYRFHIDWTNAFYSAVDKAHTLKMMYPTKTLPFGYIIQDKKSAWIKEENLSDTEAGRPIYVYKGFPLIFHRENKKVGVTEYVEAFFGIEYYINLTVFETKK